MGDLAPGPWVAADARSAPQRPRPRPHASPQIHYTEAMADERSTSSYRTPADAAPEAAPPPSEQLAEFSAPILGPMQLELGLAAPIRLSLDREELRVTPGSGLRLRARAPLPPLLVRHLHLDMRRAELGVDGTGLGAFETRAVSVAIAAAFGLVFPWQPGSSLVDVAMQNLPQRTDGRRRVLRKGPVSIWVDPDTRLDLAVTAESAELALSHAVYVRVLAIGIGILAVRYLFGRQRLEIDGPPGQPLRNAMLHFVAWVATRWLRRRLPEALAKPGYDPFADPERRAHFTELAARFKTAKPEPAPNAADPTADQAPDAGDTTDLAATAHSEENTAPTAGATAEVVTADDAPAPSDSQPADATADTSPAPAPADSRPADAAAGTSPAPAPSASRAKPVPSDSPVSDAPDDVAARLRALKDLKLSPGPVPDASRMLVIIPLGERGGLALCTAAGAAVELRRRGPRVALDAPGGLYLHAEQIPGLESLQIRHVALSLGPLVVELGTSPALGTFAQAAIQQVARTVVATKLPPATLARLEALGTSDELLRQRMGASAELVITTPRDQEVLLRHGPDALELAIPAGLQLHFEGLDFLPDATVKGLRYRWDDGDLQLDATPAMGELGNLFITQLLRHRGAPHLPPLLGARGPDASTPIDPEIAAARPAVLFETSIPALGPLQVRLDPNDRVAIRLSAAALELETVTGVAAIIPELQLALVLKQFRLELGKRGFGTDATLGDYITEILTRILEDKALPPLRQRLPMWRAGADPAAAWQIVRVAAGPLGAIVVQVPAAGAFVVERTADAVELRVDPALEIRAEKQQFVPLLAFKRLHWQPADDAWIVDFDPPVGPLIPEFVQRLVHKLAPAPVLARVAKMLALPEPVRVALPPALPPSSPGKVVWETTVPQLGPVKVSIDPEHAVDVVLDRKVAAVTLGTGAVVRLPGLGFNVQVQGVEVTLRPLGAHLGTRPEAGPLFDHVILHALRALLKDHAEQFWPTDPAPRIGQDTLLVLGRGQSWGPLRVSVPTDAAIEVHLDRTGFRVRAQAGVFISGPAIDWLPDFYLHTLGYTFETGAVTLEISGIEETYYHEKHPVSPITQALLSHLVKVLALPKVPDWTATLGLRKFPLPPVPVVDPARIRMYKLALPGEFGEILISMAPDDSLTVRADDEEVSFISERGLLATLPGLRFELSLRGVRYHMQSGEIQVGGLGQLENALLEAVVEHQLALKVKQVASETPGDVNNAVGTLLEQLPVDDKGRRILFHHRMVDLLLLPNARLEVRFTADGLAFEANPPIKIDGPARIDYMFGGIRYSFADASFHLNLDNGGALLSGMFTDVIIYEVETRLNDMFKPLLPAPMREKGYSLATDPRSMEHIEQIIENFALLGKKKKKA